MKLIPLERDQKTISSKFRKADYFAIINNDSIEIIENTHKREKSKEFLKFFDTLNIDAIIVHNMGYKTFKNLKVKVYFTQAKLLDELNLDNLLLIDDKNAKELCTLGHKKWYNYKKTKGLKMPSHKHHEKLEKIKDTIVKSNLSEDEKSNAAKKIEEWYSEDKGLNLLYDELANISSKITPLLEEIGLI